MPKIQWNYVIYDRGDNSEKCSLLVFITEIEGLPSPAIFDSKSNLTELTTGRGYGYAAEEFKSEAEAMERLPEVAEAIDTYVNEVAANSRKIGIRSKTSKSNEATQQ